MAGWTCELVGILKTHKNCGQGGCNSTSLADCGVMKNNTLH